MKRATSLDGDAEIRHATLADLTWAELYSKKIQSDLRVLFPTIRKSAMSRETAESATLLRQQLQVARHTLDEMRRRARI